MISQNHQVVKVKVQCSRYKCQLNVDYTTKDLIYHIYLGSLRPVQMYSIYILCVYVYIYICIYIYIYM